MKKTNFILSVSDYALSKIDWQIEAFQEGTKIGVEALDLKQQGMIDEGIVESFQELEDIGLADEMEGYMTYDGELSVSELVDKLISMGYNAKLA
jgi:hypothetical protein